MILPTVPRIVVLGCPGIRVVSRRISSIILADLAMRGIAISFSTLARVVSARSFLRFLCWPIPAGGSHCHLRDRLPK